MSAKLLPWCLTLWDPRDCSPPGPSVLGILQPSILEWVAVPSSRGILLTLGSNRYFLCPSALAGRVFTTSTTWEA